MLLDMKTTLTLMLILTQTYSNTQKGILGVTVKIVINSCYGGFSLSALATQKYYEKKGQPVYFFKGGLGKDYEPISLKEAEFNGWWTAFNVPEPAVMKDKDNYKSWSKQCLTNRPDNRTDPDLVAVVEELGPRAASGSCADLRVIEIPDDVNWEITEYDGYESVEEVHRSWS